MGEKQRGNRERILEVAERAFSEKGYDGARVDQIAAGAGVNKALIYYYFRNKRALLGELLERFFRESARLLLSYVEHGGLETEPSPEADGIFEEYFRYFEEKRNLLRVLLMESLKAGKESPPLFKLVDFGDLIHDKEVDRVRAAGKYPAEGMQQALVAEFFTGVMPMVCYVLFRAQWCRHFGISAEELRRHFDRAMEMTHAAYHRAVREESAKGGSA